MGGKNFAIIWLFCTACGACTATSIPVGTYEVSWTYAENQRRTTNQIELVVLPEPIELTQFDPAVHAYIHYFGAETNQTVCAISRYTSDQEGAETYLTLSRPAQQESDWKIKLFESHHAWVWLILTAQTDQITGTYHSTGYVGEHTEQLTVNRIGDADIELCVKAGEEVLEQVGRME